MADEPVPDLRLDPHTLPELHRALTDARELLAEPLRGLEADARLSRPWLGDPVSARIAATYARHGTDGPDAAVGMLRKHVDRWERARGDAADSERDYTAAERAATDAFDVDRQ